MEEEEAKRLRIHCTKIVKNVRARDVIPYLFENNVLTANEMESVTLPTLTTEDGMLKLVALLLKKKGAFAHFCDALDKSDSDWLATELRECQSNVSNVPDETNPALEELEKNEKMNLLVKQLNHQTLLIEMLMSKQPKDSADGKQVPIAEMPELKQAMDENNLSETEVVRYIEFAVTQRTKSGVDQMDSGSTLAERRRSMSASSLNFTETVALKTAVDIVSYLATDEENASPPKTKYEATMRRTAGELITNHRQLFEAYINRIKESNVTGIDFLFNVADEIFRDKQYNWGRIAALYAFCGWLAKHDVFEDEDQPRQALGEFLGYYVSQKLGHWIEDNGGWDSFLDQFPEGTKKKDDFWSVALVGLMIGVGAAATFSIASRP